MMFKRLLTAGLMALFCAGTATAASQLNSVQVTPTATTATVDLRTTGSFAHKEYRPDEYTLMVDLTGVAANAAVERAVTVNSSALKGYKISHYTSASGGEVTRINFSLGEQVTADVNDVSTGLQILLTGDPLSARSHAASVAPVAPSPASRAAAPSKPAQTETAKLPQSASPAVSAAVPAVVPVAAKAAAAPQPPSVQAARDAAIQPSAAKSALPPVSVRSVSVRRSKGTLDVVIDGPSSANSFLLKNPDRLVLDFNNAVLRPSVRNIEVHTKDVQQVRVGRFSSEPPVARIVIDLGGPRAFDVVPSGKQVVVRVRTEDAEMLTPPIQSAPAPVLASANAPAVTAQTSADSSTSRDSVGASAALASASRVKNVTLPATASTLPHSDLPVRASSERAATSAETATKPRSQEPEPAVEVAKPTPPAPVVAEKAAEKAAEKPVVAVTPAAPAKPAVEIAKPTPPAPVVAEKAAEKPVVAVVPAAPAKPAVEIAKPAPPAPVVAEKAVVAVAPPAPTVADQHIVSVEQPTVSVAPVAPAAPAKPPVEMAKLVPPDSPFHGQFPGSGAPAPYAPQNAPQTSGAAPSSPAPKYTGEPISVNFKDVDLKDFFRLIHEISGLNIVLDPTVRGSVTLVLDDVPWDQALDIVLKNNGLDRELQGRVLRIAATDTLRREAVDRRAQSEAIALAVDRQTISRYLSYAKARDVVPIIKKFLSARGDIIADERTNSLIISDIPGVLPSVDRLITQLDRKSQEVEIEVRVVSASRSFTRDLGFQLGFNWGNGVTSVGGNNPNGSTSTGATTGTTANNNNTVPLFSSFPVAGPTTGISLSNITATYGIDAILTAAETHNLAKVLSRPRVVTQSNVKAEVKQGVKIPVYTASTANANASVSYVDAVLRLSVTPQITADNTIFLTVDVENTQPSGQINQNYILTTQQATTQVLVTDGGTVVIGGVIQTTNSVSTSQTPVLGDIPWLGNLFKSRSVSTETDELIFFITPKIIQT